MKVSPFLFCIFSGSSSTAFVAVSPPRRTLPSSRIANMRLFSAIPQDDPSSLVTDDQLLNGMFQKQYQRRQDLDLTNRSTEAQDEFDLMEARMARERSSSSNNNNNSMVLPGIVVLLVAAVASGVFGGAVLPNDDHMPAATVVEQRELVLPAKSHTNTIPSSTMNPSTTTSPTTPSAMPAATMDTTAVVVGPSVEDLNKEVQRDEFNQQQQAEAEEMMGMGMMDMSAGFMF